MVLTEEPETGAGQGAPSPSHGLGGKGRAWLSKPKESSAVGLGRLAETGAEKSTDVSPGLAWREPRQTSLSGHSQEFCAFPCLYPHKPPCSDSQGREQDDKDRGLIQRASREYPARLKDTKDQTFAKENPQTLFQCKPAICPITSSSPSALLLTCSSLLAVRETRATVSSGWGNISRRILRRFQESICVPDKSCREGSYVFPSYSCLRQVYKA